MTRELFDKKLREMQDDVLIMGSMVEKAIQRSVEALRNRDVSLSNAIVQEDLAINAKRYEIEEKCIHTIALQQPMAADLRILVAVLFIASELERMADHAEGIGRINLMLGEEPLPRPLGDIMETSARVTCSGAPSPPSSSATMPPPATSATRTTPSTRSTIRPTTR
jgi:phosphate transport system protein